MSNRILVTFAGRTGSTAEVAKTIDEVLTSRGYSVDLKSVKEKPSMEGYSTDDVSLNARKAYTVPVWKMLTPVH